MPAQVCACSCATRMPTRMQAPAHAHTEVRLQLASSGSIVPLKGWLVAQTRMGDHAAFWDNYYPAIQVTDTQWYRNEHWHKRTDAPGTLDYGAMARLCMGLASFCKESQQI